MWPVLKWFVGGVALLLLIVLLFRGPLFRMFFHFEDLRERHTGRTFPTPSGPDTTQEEVPLPVGMCIDAALDETARLLEFTDGPALSSAAGSRRTGKANCIGYAALFQERCRWLLDSAGFADEWQVHHLRGSLYLGDLNVHRLFSSPFWKDHDICAVENIATGQCRFVDPSLFDVTGIRRVRGPAN